MHLGLYRREHLQSAEADLIGSATVDQFQRTHGALQAWGEAEHNDDGTHGDITARSITLNGPFTMNGEGPFTAPEVAAVLRELRLRARLLFATDEGDLQVLFERGDIGGTPVLTHPNAIVPDGIAVALGDSTAPYNALYLDGTFIGLVISGVSIKRDALAGAGTLSVDGNWLPDANDTRDLGQHIGFFPRRWRNLYLSGGVREFGRSADAGTWQAQAFSAGHYTGNGAMTWTVDATAFQYSRYAVVGKTLFWKLYVAWFTGTSSIGGTPNNTLLITLPAGLTMPTTNQGLLPAGIAVNGGGVVDAYVAGVSSTQVGVVMKTGANWGGTVGLSFGIELEIA